MTIMLKRMALMACLSVAAVAGAAEQQTSDPATDLRIATDQGLYSLYKEDISDFTVVLVEEPADMFINGKANGILTLSNVDDLGMGFLSDKTKARPFSLTLGVWLPNVVLENDDDEQQKESGKTYLDEETVMRQAYSGQIAGAQLVRLYLLAEHHQELAEKQLLQPFIAYPSNEDDEQAAEDVDNQQTIVRRADATTEQNRPTAIREFDSGLLVMPSPQVMQVNAVTAGVAEPAFAGGYR
ncbi:MAG: hypothetical protein JKY21_09410 [Alcanivorax sp.]|nr:hypothetical protein [Alcanivorax sp.]